MKPYLLLSLANALIWCGLALLFGAPLIYLPAVACLAFPFSFFALMFVAGAKQEEQPGSDDRDKSS